MSAPSGGVKTLGWNRLYISIIFCPGRLEPGLIVMYMTGATKKQPEFIALNLLVSLSLPIPQAPAQMTPPLMLFSSENSPTLSLLSPLPILIVLSVILLSTYEI